MAKPMPKGFKCECGKFHEFSLWVYAHWTIDIVHTCDCGRKHSIVAGVANLMEGE